MTGKKLGRPKGAGYDHHLETVADIILASGNKKTFREALEELFSGGFKFPVSLEAARKRLRKIWDKDNVKLLANAAKRAEERRIMDTWQKIDQIQEREALDLLELSMKKENPVSSNTNFGIEIFMPKATPEDFEQNPKVRLMMSYHQFQVAFARRYIEQKVNQRREKAGS